MTITINHNHFIHFGDKEIINKLNQIIMTQAEATQILTDVKTKVDQFIANGGGSGNLTAELEAAVNAVKNSVDGLPATSTP